MLHHIEIYVRDLMATREFYDIFMPDLGYEIFQEWEEGFSYRCEDEYIVFVQVREKYKDISYNRCNIGLNHLAFKCSSKAYVDNLREVFRKKGITLLYDELYPHAGGVEHYALYFEDPDRIKLEIVYSENI